MAGETSRSEGLTKAKRLFPKARDYAREGKYLGGHTPYGLDLACYSPAAIWCGGPPWPGPRPGGGGQEYAGYLPARPPGSYMQWTPSEDPEVLATVSYIFQRAADGFPLNRIATDLNALGVGHPLGPWAANRISRMVR